MSVLRHWKILLSLVAIFLVGAVTGSLLTVRVVKREIGRRVSPDVWAATTLQQFQRRLELTPEQVEKLRPVFEQRKEDLRRIRDQTIREILLVVQETNAQVEQELTPAQQEKFEKLKQELRARLRERAKTKRSEP